MRQSAPRVRETSPEEARLITRLLDADFIGASEVHEQSRRGRVRTEDYGGALVLAFEIPNDAVPASVSHRIPVEAEAPDVDGVMIHALVHVVSGILKEVEIFREDSERIHQLPRSTAFRVITT